MGQQTHERIEMIICQPHFQQKYKDPKDSSSTRIALLLSAVPQTGQQLWNAPA